MKERKERKLSGLFRKYLFSTMSIILTSFTFVGILLSLMVSAVWMNEKLDLLEENTKSITENTELVLQSEYMGTGRGTVLVICNSLYQASDVLDADFFVVNEKGEPVYCKHIIQNVGNLTGNCIVHDNYQIPEAVMEQLRNGEDFRDTGKLDGVFASNNFIVGCPLEVDGVFRGAVFGTMPSTNGLVKYVALIIRLFAYASIFAFLIDLVIVYVNVYRTTRPLRQMSKAAKQYANGDFSQRIFIDEKRRNKYPTEIDELAQAFNSMAQDLSALEMSRRSFVSNVSHELKTPMTTIGGFIDGILDGTIDEENEKKYLIIVSDEVKRLSRLVTAMLNMSRLEAGKMELKPSEFDLSEMLFTTLLSFEQMVENKRIDIEGLENLTEKRIVADKDLINQVVYNLVDNAVKFTPEGGCISLEVKEDSEKVIAKIRNTGRGIPESERETIFERFYKTDKSRSYDSKSAGVGLYLVKTIVEIHGGTVVCRSEEGEYTEFIFTLPKM
ncbi:MAG: HAMP domain-containing histidine kinase [Clostridia bacterium]|nr:HAMP domain-containing histidine kinase [Clostridia bacterium]